MKTSKNGVERGCFRKHLRWRAQFFWEMKEECKAFCVKLVLRSIVTQKGTNILNFYIFDTGAEYRAECSAESGAK